MNITDLKVERIVLRAHINSLVNYYEKRLPEIEEEYEKAIKDDHTSVGIAMGMTAGSYKACSHAMLIEIKDIKEKLDKLHRDEMG